MTYQQIIHNTGMHNNNNTHSGHCILDFSSVSVWCGVRRVWLGMTGMHTVRAVKKMAEILCAVQIN